MKKIKEKVHLFRKEIVGLASADQVPDSIYQLNVQIFPVAQTQRKEAK